jgi:FixJ family two-component response regulator
VTARRPLIALVDDDESVRESLLDLLHEFGFTASAFASAKELLTSDRLSQANGLILDVGMPGMSGPELHQELMRRGYSIPTLFITARADEGLRTSLLRQGAVACLYKPFSDEALRVVLDAAIPEKRD